MNVIQTQRPCVRFRPLLDSYVSNELLMETNVEVLRHLEECPECATALDNRLRTRQLLKRAVATQAVPEKLRSGVLAGLTQPAPIVAPRAIRRETWRGWQAVAAGVALLMLSGFGLQVINRHHARTDELLAIGWRDHLHCALGAIYSSTPPSREVMMTRLGGEYNVLLSVADRKLGDYRLVEGHRCTVKGRDYAHLVLHKEGALLSVALAKKRGSDEFVAPWFGNREVASATKSGLSTSGFEAPGHVVFVVSNEELGENQRTAEVLAPSIRSILRAY